MGKLFFFCVISNEAAEGKPFRIISGNLMRVWQWINSR